MYGNKQSFKASYLGSYSASGNYGNPESNTYREQFSSGYIDAPNNNPIVSGRNLRKIQM